MITYENPHDATLDQMARCVSERITRSMLHPYVDEVYVIQETDHAGCPVHPTGD